MQRRIIRLAIPLAFAYCPVLLAADFGFSNSQCSHWLNGDKSVDEPAHRQWILGYLSGAARFGQKDLTALDPQQAIQRLKSFCNRHPEKSLEAAVLAEILIDR